MPMDPDDESDMGGSDHGDLGGADGHLDDASDSENGALDGADGDSDDGEEHQGPDSAEPEAPPLSPASSCHDDDTTLVLGGSPEKDRLNDVAGDDSGDESPAETGFIDKGPMSPVSDSTDNESRSPWECDGTTRKWKDLKRAYKKEGKAWPPVWDGNGPSSAFPRLPPMPESDDEDDQGITPAKRSRDYLNVPSSEKVSKRVKIDKDMSMEAKSNDIPDPCQKK